MLVIQVLFGFGEAGAFPVATRSLARWMRPTERGFAQGVTHAGSRLGSALTPTILLGFTLLGISFRGVIPAYGWRMAFVLFGVAGAVWAAVWFLYYRDTPEEHRGVNAADRERDRTVIELLMHAVGYGAVVEQRGVHFVHAGEQMLLAAHVQERFLLSGEGCLR